MRYIITVILCAISLACFGQASDGQREARMEQIRQMMEERRREAVERAARGNAGVTVGESGGIAGRGIAAGAGGDRGVSGEAGYAQPTDILERAGQAVPAKDRRSVIRAKLDTLAKIDPKYTREVEKVSVAGLPLAEMLRNIAKVYDVNIAVRGCENIRVTSNLAQAKITDLILFLCGEYSLDVDVVGNIVSVFPAAAPVAPPKAIKVAAGRVAETVSYDLDGDRLADVTRMLASVGRVNFIVPNNLNSRSLSGHGHDMTIDDAVAAIASANGILARKNSAGIWELAEDDGTGSYRRQSAFGEDQIYVDSLGAVTVHIARGNVRDIITDLCGMQGLNSFFVTPVNHTVSLDVSGVTFEALLGVMFAGTEYGYYYEEGIYFFGTFDDRTLGSVRVIPMQYRSVAKIEEHIPEQLKEGLELKTFNDLNAIIASGDQRRVQRVENFLRSVDRRVPLVTIEVMIVDATKQRVLDVGIDAGFGKSDVIPGGSLTGIDVTLNAASVNSLINSFNGFGSVNLGKVGAGFYVGLQFLEDNGIIEMRSTPKLSTLNAHEATLTSGETRYYKEVSNNYYGTQNPIPTESYVWKSVDANLEIKITPFVSEDEHITLDITIDQTEFTAREEADAPPGTAKRSFSSLVRVQNEEMVLLGGIDQNVSEQSNRGLPLVSRLPVLRWIFGKNRDQKKEHRLNVFIKPTLVE